MTEWNAGGPAVRDTGEFGLIARMRRILEARARRPLLMGLGDDAAVFAPPAGPMVFTADAMIEDTHFKTSWCSAEDLAHKAMASNVSDLAAKGAEPLYALVTLGVPGSASAAWIDAFYHELSAAQERWGADVIGGDTVLSEKVVVSIAMLGRQTTPDPVRNSGARPGDWIFVTGTLGCAAAGLEILLKNGPYAGDNDKEWLVKRFLRPEPRLREAARLVRWAKPAAMTDISDGLARDLAKICEASGTGARIQARHLPASPALRAHAGERWPGVAWQGGEDYELLFTLPPAAAETLAARWEPGMAPAHCVGEMTDAGFGIHLEGWDGPPGGGFDHFRRDA